MYTERYIGDRIKERRTKLGLTQKELASKISEGIDPDAAPHTQISNWESGSKIPGTVALTRLCNALNCDIDYLLGEIDVHHRATYDVIAQTGLDKDAVEKIQQIHNYSHGDLGVVAHGKTISTLSILSEFIKSDGFQKLMNELSFYTLYSQLLSNPADRDELNLDEYDRFHKWADNSGMEIKSRKDIAEMHLQTAADTLKNIFRDIVQKGSDGIRPIDI